MHVFEEVADEHGVYYPRIAFVDENGNPFTPDALFWSLTDLDGKPINGRLDIEVDPPENPLELVLSGADLAAMGDHLVARILTFSGEYTSFVHGSEQPFSFQARFNIQPRVGG